MSDVPDSFPSAEGADATQDPLRVGIIGYGLAGSVFHAPLIAATPGMEVTAIVSGDSGRQAKARRDFPNAALHATAEEMLAAPDQLDLVVVASPNRVHVPQGVAALEAGLAVVVDKPVAPSIAGAEQLIETARRTGKMLTIFQNRRWDNDFLTVRQLIAGDVLGPIQRFESRFERFRPEPRPGAWRERSDPEEAGGLLFDLGAHLVDQALQLFGTPTSVYAELAERRPGAVVDDDVFVALRFADGQVAHLWASAVPRWSGPRFRVVGLRGVYEKRELDPQEEALRLGMRPGDEGWGREPREQWGHLVTEFGGLPVDGVVETLPGNYEAYYALVRDSLLMGTPPPVDPAGVLLALRVIENARESAHTGSAIPFAARIAAS